MPIFEYRCDDCGNKFEKLVRASAREAAAECPSCGRDHVTTQVSSFAARTHGMAQESAPSCASGMCASPEWCGRN
jgi:putative FmdB family regulatory protein